MEIHYYKTDSVAVAFAMASKDAKNWDFRTLKALAELAAETCAGLLQRIKMGMSTICTNSGGQFNVFLGSKRGIGIGLLSLTGRESGIDDPAAAEILDYHRDLPNVGFYADQLVGFSPNFPDIDALDAAYELLTRAGFLIRTNSTALGDKKLQRPAYCIHRPQQTY